MKKGYIDVVFKAVEFSCVLFQSRSCSQGCLPAPGCVFLNVLWVQVLPANGVRTGELGCVLPCCSEETGASLALGGCQHSRAPAVCLSLNNTSVFNMFCCLI